MTAKLQKGFTFLEIVIVIAIIGVLTTLFITTSTGSSKKARDARRKSDIKQYQNALEVFASKNNTLYPAQPVVGGVPASQTLCGNLSITNCPDDPTKGQTGNYYRYQSDGGPAGSTNGTKYFIWAGPLEGMTGFFVVCSNGKSGIIPEVINYAFGDCPVGL